MRVSSNRRRQAADMTPGPWAKWKTKDRASLAIRWLEKYIVLPSGVTAGQPMRLAPFQKDFIRKIYAPGTRSAVLVMAKGGTKSTTLAALALFELFNVRPGGAPNVICVAVILPQAIDAVWGPAADMVEAHPELSRRALTYRSPGNHRIETPFNKGQLRPKAADPASLQGASFTFGVVDELSEQLPASWSALLGASGKRPNSILVGISTPAPNRENALWAIRQRWLASQEPGGIPIPHFSWTEYKAPDGCDIHDERMWHLASPALAAGFHDIEALRMSVEQETENTFRTYHLCQWVDDDVEESFCGPDTRALWHATEDAEFEPEPRSEVFVGVDASKRRDSSAVTSITSVPGRDGRLFAWTRIWKPTRNEDVDLDQVADYVRGLSREFKLPEVAFDPMFFGYHARLLEREGFKMVEVPQQSFARMSAVYGRLRERIRAREIWHPPDPDFEQHIVNAVARDKGAQAGGFVLYKRREADKIDATAALGMALDRFEHRKQPVGVWVGVINQPPPLPPGWR